jgi:hypothetical protein
MKLLGDWNWYLPKKLNWLPQVGGEHAPRIRGEHAPDPARA